MRSEIASANTEDDEEDDDDDDDDEDDEDEENLEERVRLPTKFGFPDMSPW